jgi:hypothetical protein
MDTIFSVTFHFRYQNIDTALTQKIHVLLLSVDIE